MEANLLLEQYKRYKMPALEASPFKCLLSADIELNPHQINAFCAAVQALKTGGIVLPGVKQREQLQTPVPVGIPGAP